MAVGNPDDEYNFNIYRNFLLFSMQTPQKNKAAETDLSVCGDAELLAKGLSEMMNRHPVLVRIILESAQYYLQEHPDYVPPIY